MKNLKIVTLLTMALAGLLLVLPSTASASTQLPSGTFDIAFNGFCDGMELTRTGPVSLAGTLTGCYLGVWSTIIYGRIYKRKGVGEAIRTKRTDHPLRNAISGCTSGRKAEGVNRTM
jgi:hypothetical protein